MATPTIVAYLKRVCGWSDGVRAILRKYDLSYEEREITEHPQHYEEMVRKTGQRLSPCVEINGTMLADVSGDEVEAYLRQQGLISPVQQPADRPTDRGCDPGYHVEPDASSE